MCDMLGMSCSALGADSEKSWVLGQAVFSLLSLTLYVMAFERVVNTAKLFMIKLIRAFTRCFLQAGLNSCVKACQVRF